MSSIKDIYQEWFLGQYMGKATCYALENEPLSNRTRTQVFFIDGNLISSSTLNRIQTYDTMSSD